MIWYTTFENQSRYDKFLTRAKETTMSDFDASVIYGIVVESAIIEKLKSEAILTKKWYDDDDLYQIGDWLNEKYKPRLRKGLRFTCTHYPLTRVLGLSIAKTGMDSEGVFECTYLEDLPVMNEILEEIYSGCQPKLYLSGVAS